MNVVDLVARQEGYREFVYDDATGQPLKQGDTIKGHPTIGYGLCVEEGVGVGLPRATAQSLLESHIANVQSALSRSYSWYTALDTVRQAALISSAFNLGLVGLGGFRKALGACAVPDWDEAADEFRDSKWWRNSLTHHRAQQVSTMIQTGEWPS